MPNTHASVCLDCPAGFYCDGKTPDKAIACPAGAYCPIGSSSGLNCGKGTYNPFTTLVKADQCTACVEGYYCDVEGMKQIDTSKTCLPGYYCAGGNKAGNEVKCPAGSFCLK